MISFAKSFVQKKKETKLPKEEIFHGLTGGSRENYIDRLVTGNISYGQMNLMYIANSWVRSCVDKTVERVCDTPITIKRLNNDPKKIDEAKAEKEKLINFLNNPNDLYESFHNINKKLIRDLMIYDAGALELVRVVNQNNMNKDVTAKIYSTPGTMIRLNVDKTGLFKSDNQAYVQVDSDGVINSTFNKDRILYYLLNPRSNKIYGLSPLESLINTVTADLDTSQYNHDFYKNNATPRFAVLMEDVGIGQGSAALQRFRKWWDQELKGKPHRPIVIGTEKGKIQFEKVGLSNEEMQFQEYSKWLLSKIMAVYKMQPAVLGIDSEKFNKNSAEEQVKQFKIDVVKPVTRVMADKLNMQIVFSKYCFGSQHIYLDYDLDLVDKEAQSKIHESYLRSGVVTINEIRIVLGLDPVSWGNVPYLQNNVTPFGSSKNNGTQALPGNVEEAERNLVEANNSDLDLSNTSLSKKQVHRLIDHSLSQKSLPVGWEFLDITERKALLEKIILDREKYFNRIFIQSNV